MVQHHMKEAGDPDVERGVHSKQGHGFVGINLADDKLGLIQGMERPDHVQSLRQQLRGQCPDVLKGGFIFNPR
ncbi:hypothetical protein D3C72_2507090 [compost metagenome]